MNIKDKCIALVSTELLALLPMSDLRTILGDEESAKARRARNATAAILTRAFWELNYALGTRPGEAVRDL